MNFFRQENCKLKSEFIGFRRLDVCLLGDWLRFMLVDCMVGFLSNLPSIAGRSVRFLCPSHLSLH
jgi:hypothetical protein